MTGQKSDKAEDREDEKEIRCSGLLEERRAPAKGTYAHTPAARRIRSEICFCPLFLFQFGTCSDLIMLLLLKMESSFSATFIMDH